MIISSYSAWVLAIYIIATITIVIAGILTKDLQRTKLGMTALQVLIVLTTAYNFQSPLYSLATNTTAGLVVHCCPVTILCREQSKGWGMFQSDIVLCLSINRDGIPVILCTLTWPPQLELWVDYLSACASIYLCMYTI